MTENTRDIQTMSNKRTGLLADRVLLLDDKLLRIIQ